MNITHINTTDIRGGAAQVMHMLHTRLNAETDVQSHALVRDKQSSDPRIARIAVSQLSRYVSFAKATDLSFIGGTQQLNHPFISDADIVHVHNVHGYYFHLQNLVGIAREKKIVWTLHDMWPITSHCGYTQEIDVNEYGMYRCERRTDAPPLLWSNDRRLSEKKKQILGALDMTIVTPSLWLKQLVEKSYLQSNRIVHIPNGVDTTVFTPSDIPLFTLRKRLGLPQDQKIALFVATKVSNPFKGAEFIDLLVHDDRLSDIHFVTIGDNSPYTNRPNVTVLPYTQERGILASYYQAADMFIHPSLLDNHPLVVLESLCSGTPVVGFAVGGVSEQIDHMSNGYLANGQEYTELVEGVQHIAAQTLDRIEIAAQAKNKFSVDRMVQEYKTLYERI